MRRLYGVNFQSHFSRDEDVDFMPALPDSEAVVVPIERQPVIEEAAEMLEEDSGAVLGNIDDIL